MEQMLTVEKTYRRAHADGFPISKQFLYQRCKDGSLKAVRTGSKFLIYYPNLITLLQNGEPEQPQPQGLIRRIG